MRPPGMPGGWCGCGCCSIGAPFDWAAHGMNTPPSLPPSLPPSRPSVTQALCRCVATPHLSAAAPHRHAAAAAADADAAAHAWRTRHAAAWHAAARRRAPW
jgi:hypothetical protein